jgi:hypothetical protein
VNSLLQQLGIDINKLDNSEYRIECIHNGIKYVYKEYSPIPYWYIFKMDLNDESIIYSESSLR